MKQLHAVTTYNCDLAKSNAVSKFTATGRPPSRPSHVQRDLPWHRTVHEWNPEIAGILSHCPRNGLHCSPAFVQTVLENPTWK